MLEETLDEVSSSVEYRALGKVLEISSKLGLDLSKLCPSVIKARQFGGGGEATLFYLTFKKSGSIAEHDFIHLPIAVLTNDGMLRFLIPNNQEILEVIDI